MDNHRNCTYYAEFHNTKWLRMGCLQWYNRTKNTYRNFLFIGFVILIVMLLIVGLCSCKDIKKMLFLFFFRIFFLKICSFTWLYQEKNTILVSLIPGSLWFVKLSGLVFIRFLPTKILFIPAITIPPPRGRGSESSCKP